MTQVTIEALLRQKIGLDASTIGSSSIARVVRQHMADGGLTDLKAYLNRLQTSTQELEKLIESVLVPETWFFRDREPFVLLSRYAISEWLPTHPNGVLRILSVPCATGEEPYSIAIALIEAGLSPKNFCIHAVDISKNLLLKAQRAIYSQNSFRGNNLSLPYGNSYALRERYFTQVGHEYQLSASVKNTVNFIQGNLLDADFLSDKQPYDVVFCRNVLIYFDPSARERTVQVLNRLLKNQGLLFVGHSETGQISTSGFVPVPHRLAFAYRKRTQEHKNVEAEVGNGSVTDVTDRLSPIRKVTGKIDKSSAISTFKSPASLSPPDGASQRVAVLRPATLTPRYANAPLPDRSTTRMSRFPITATPAPTAPPNLETARRLADRGEFDESATLCETYLSQNCTSAEAYVLLGQVRQAVGNEEQAERCFHKAIYLEPNHYEALIHLALLKEQRGDIANAALIRQRIQRLQ